MSTDPWNSPEHAKAFDFRAKMPLRMLKQDLSRFNDVQMLQRINMDGTFLEVGCATGEMYRYVHAVWPDTHYLGLDVSESAVVLATQKYGGHLFSTKVPLNVQFDTVYCKDVIQHQDNPYGFIENLVHLAHNAQHFRRWLKPKLRLSESATRHRRLPRGLRRITGS